jgi:hypothetical protein
MRRWTEADLQQLGSAVAEVAPKRSKYGNRKKVVNGIEFDSAKEAARYMELQLMRKAGLITHLRVHPVYDIVVCGVKVCSYKPDFDYHENGAIVVEDVKVAPTKTPVYQLKKKLLKATHGIDIREVT